MTKRKKDNYHHFHRFGPVAVLAEEINFHKLSKEKNPDKLRKAVLEALIEIENKWKTPEVGKGITIQVGSDSYSGTIISVSKSGKQFSFIRDRLADHIKKYNDRKHGNEFAVNLQGEIEFAKWSRASKEFVTSRRCPIYIGHREDYRDPSF